jgi:WD40 repeat protein
MRPFLACLRRPPAGAVAALLVYGAGILVLDSCLPRKPIASLVLPEPGHPCCFSRDGRTLATEHGDGPATLRLWDWRAGRLRAAWPEPDGGLYEVLLSPDGAWAAGVGRGPYQDVTPITRLILWEAASGAEVERWPVEDGAGDVYVRFSPDGAVLALTCRLEGECVVCLWDLPGHQLRAVLARQEGPLAFSPDGRLLATMTGEFYARRVRLWSARSGEAGVALEHPTVPWRQDKDLYAVFCRLAFSADGSALGVLGALTSADDEGLQRAACGAYEPGEPTHLARLWDVASGGVRAERVLYKPPGVAAASEVAWEGVLLLGEARAPGTERASDPLTGAGQLAFPVKGFADYECY